MAQPQLIGIDWGTSSFRGYLIDDNGAVLDRRQSAMGILKAGQAGFEATLQNEVAEWRRAHGSLPIVMSGMIGSRQGWQEAPYARCPAGIAAIARDLQACVGTGGDRIAIVPGIMTERDGVPDVMRGEETQILGALALAADRTGAFVLPGTHAKWVDVRDGLITGFATYMTGEAYAALKDHTILGRSMAEGDDDEDETPAFLEGVRAGARPGGPGALLNRIFSARTLGLFDRLAPSQIAPYLSGLLIGAEIEGAASAGGPVTIVGSDALAGRYEAAGAALGLQMRRAAPDCVVAGHLAIARASGLIGASA